MTIPELLQTLAGKVVNHITCTFQQYRGITDKDSNTLYYVTDRGAIFKGAIKLCDLTEIGDLRNLETSNSTNLVSAINEVNQKATNNQGNGVINDSTISPFAGFMTNDDLSNAIEGATTSTEGDVYYSRLRNRFYLKVGINFYVNWENSYLYNYSGDSGYTSKTGKIFSYNDKHYTIIDGKLQDMSVLLSEAQVTTLIDEAKTQAKDYTDGVATQTLSSSNFYTDEQINNIPQGNLNQFGLVRLSTVSTDGIAATPAAITAAFEAKIKCVPALPTQTTPNVLYLIEE